MCSHTQLDSQASAQGRWGGGGTSLSGYETQQHNGSCLPPSPLRRKSQGDLAHLHEKLWHTHLMLSVFVTPSYDDECWSRRSAAPPQLEPATLFVMEEQKRTEELWLFPEAVLSFWTVESWSCSWVCNDKDRCYHLVCISPARRPPVEKYCSIKYYKHELGRTSKNTFHHGALLIQPPPQVLTLPLTSGGV